MQAFKQLTLCLFILTVSGTSFSSSSINLNTLQLTIVATETESVAAIL